MSWIRNNLTLRGRRIGRIAAHLPGVNCRACGFLSCRDYARSIHDSEGNGELCPVCDRAMYESLQEYLDR